jgi:hypothetical protein
MLKMLETPEFKNEKEEANWWFDNRGLLLEEFKKAAKDGTLGFGTLAAQGLTASGLTPTTPILLDQEN